MIEQHGGALDFENLRDAAGCVLGTRFSFTLPLAPPAADDAPRRDAPADGTAVDGPPRPAGERGAGEPVAAPVKPADIEGVLR